MVARTLRSSQKGFTLVEILIAMALVTGITLLMYASVTPWLNLSQKLTTERKLAQARSALEVAYRSNAMTVESVATAVMTLDGKAINPSTIQGGPTGSETKPEDVKPRTCDFNSTAADALAPFVTESSEKSLRDGTQQPLCVFVSELITPTRDIEGVKLNYHVVAVVAVGADGHLDTDTAFDTKTGKLTLMDGGDDTAIVVSGYPIQYELYLETRKRMDRIADIYGQYFTSRFLANPARDYSIDYFAGGTAAPWDVNCKIANNTLPACPDRTGGTWAAVGTALSALGVGPQEKLSAWETNNSIEVANEQLSSGQIVAGVQVQEPASRGAWLPPYTALIRARLPGPTANYAVQVVPGNY